MGQQPSTEKEFADRYAGKILTVREFYSGSSLKFDATGKLIKGGKPGNWPHDGSVFVNSLKIQTDRVELSGKRVYIQFGDEVRQVRNLKLAAGHSEYADLLSMRADFMLISLDDEEFDAGIQPLRRERNDIAIVESIDYVVFQK